MILDWHWGPNAAASNTPNCAHIDCGRKTGWWYFVYLQLYPQFLKIFFKILTQSNNRTPPPTFIIRLQFPLKIIDQLPMELLLKERVPEDRVPLVMPRECLLRCGEMQLRRRRGTQIAKTVRELSGEEVKRQKIIFSKENAHFIQHLYYYCCFARPIHK